MNDEKGRQYKKNPTFDPVNPDSYRKRAAAGGEALPPCQKPFVYWITDASGAVYTEQGRSVNKHIQYLPFSNPEVKKRNFAKFRILFAKIFKSLFHIGRMHGFNFEMVD